MTVPITAVSALHTVLAVAPWVYHRREAQP